MGWLCFRKILSTSKRRIFQIPQDELFSLSRKILHEITRTRTASKLSVLFAKKAYKLATCSNFTHIKEQDNLQEFAFIASGPCILPIRTALIPRSLTNRVSVRIQKRIQRITDRLPNQPVKVRLNLFFIDFDRSGDCLSDGL